MPNRELASTFIVSFFIFALAGCGGGGSGSGGGGGGGGGGSGLSISILQPSSIMVGVNQGYVYISGQGINADSQVLVNGQPVSTVLQVSGLLEGLLDPSVSTTPGVYQVSVQNGSAVSNSLPFTVYTPQQGPFVMRAIPGFLVGENESDAPFIVAADINGDGLADVIMPGPELGNSGSIAILLGQANGTLSAAQYIAGPTPYALAAGDVDGNGTTDLVSITSDNSSSTTVSILLGDGHGNFQQPSVQQTFAGIYPGPAYLADLDGDGKPDLVLAVEQLSGASFGILWLKNTGSGFAAPTALATAAKASFSIADFNGDWKPDILYVSGTSTTSESLHILMNQGNGSFSDQAAGGLNGIVGLATVLDFNLDGIPDLIVQVQQGTAGVLYSFAGVGNGSFTPVATLSTPGPIQLVTGDFDHDGFPDLAGPSGLEPSEILFFFGDGYGDFTIQPVVGPEGEWVAVGDFNGDGIPDVVVPDRFNFVSLALGRKDRNFPSPLSLTPATVGAISTGDINGDGLPEIFLGGNPMFGTPGTVFLNQGNSSFQLAAYTDPSSFEVADMTGKGVVDLLGGTTNLEIWPNNGSLDFSSSPITFSQPTPGVTVADMDGDGHADVVSACQFSMCAGQIFYGNGAYQFTPVSVANLNEPYVIGDFNGDGKLDIAAGGATFLNTGNRTFQEVQNSNIPLSSAGLVAVGDFNGDGKDDVAINGADGTIIIIWYSKGDGTFYEGTVIDPGQYPGGLAVGDFNGDGRLDLAVGLTLSYQVCLAFNNGGGQFTRSFFAAGANGGEIAASDLNSNGKTDLIIGNYMLQIAPPNVDVMFHQ
jgi:hypothetical protein